MATAAVVSFGKIKGGAPYTVVDSVRSRQNFATLTAATTTDTAQDGEVAIIANSGTSTIAVAIGPTPDATATAAVANTTSAGWGLAPGYVIFVPCRTGDKINVAALP